MLAKHTLDALEKLPFWMRLKQQDSDGAALLNVSGQALDRLAYMIDYAYDQCYTDSFDQATLVNTYRASLPIHHAAENITRVYSNHDELKIVYSLSDFAAYQREYDKNQLLYNENVCLIDTARHLIYTKRAHDAFDDAPHGKITYVLSGHAYEVPLSYYQIWTHLDEIGLILGCERLEKETNRAYANRLKHLHVFLRGSHRDGLVNAVGHELGLRKYITWADRQAPLILTDSMIILNSISADGVPIETSEVRLTQDGHVVLPSNIAAPESVVISYVCGAELHQLHNKQDVKLQRELFKEDGCATDLLTYYASRLEAEAPITWDHFRWGETYWDVSDKAVSGTAFVPNVMDASIKGFEHYKPQE